MICTKFCFHIYSSESSRAAVCKGQVQSRIPACLHERQSRGGHSSLLSRSHHAKFKFTRAFLHRKTKTKKPAKFQAYQLSCSYHAMSITGQGARQLCILRLALQCTSRGDGRSISELSLSALQQPLRFLACLLS